MVTTFFMKFHIPKEEIRKLQPLDKCPHCGWGHFTVENYSMMWHDGDVVCAKCNQYIRMYDAG